MSKQSPWIFCFASILAFGQAPSGEAAPRRDEEEDRVLARLVTLMNTPVYSASKRSQSALESPQATEVFTRQQIEVMGFSRFSDLLRLATGVDVWEWGPQGSRVSTRGVAQGGTPKTMQILVDGVALYNSEILAPDLDNLPLPLDAVERVEVVRGPSSSLYGANAQTGVISIRTRQASEGLRGGLRASAGQGGIFRQQAFVAFGKGEFSLLATAGGYSMQDSEATNTRILGKPGTVEIWDQVHGHQTYLRPEFRFGDGKVWMSYGAAERRGNPEVVERPSDGLGLIYVPYQGPTTRIGQVGWGQAWSATFRTEARGSWLNQQFSQGPWSPATPGDPVSVAAYQGARALDPAIDGENTFQDFRSVEWAIQANWDPNPRLHLIGGADIREMRGARTPLFGFQADVKATGSGGFVSLDWDAGPWLFSGGLRVENETLGGSRASPRVSVLARVGADGMLRAAYLTSTRSPQMGERSLDFKLPSRVLIPNLELKPERARAFELGYRHDFTQASLDLTLFKMELDDLIVQLPTGRVVDVGGVSVPERQFRNASASSPRGLEFSLSMGPAPGWEWGLSGSYVDSPDAERGVQSDYTPRWGGNAWVRLNRGRFQGFFDLQRRGAYTVLAVAGNLSQRQELDPIFQAHFQVGWELWRGFRLSVLGSNAFQEFTPTDNNSLQNTHQLFFVRRELALQGRWRF